MVVFPNGKINIGLMITGKRDDGFHDLHTIFYPVAIKDALEIIDNTSDESKKIAFSCTGIAIDDNEDDNLCIKAFHLLRKDFPQVPAVKLHLHKAIPVSAGLGGGSSDAAFTLQLLNTKYKLGLTTDQLIGYAAQLGSDCPFFMVNKPCFGTSRGESLEEIPFDLSSYNILVVNPGIHVGTRWAFSKLPIKYPSKKKSDLRDPIRLPVEKWKGLITNDFEQTVFGAYPEIGRIKMELYEKGALFALMSGSGSSVYGIFAKNACPVLNFPPNYFCKWV